VRRTPGLRISTLTDELQRLSGVEIEEEVEADRLLMTWEHVRSLRRAGMGVGSHSHTHPVLSQADPETVRREMWLSRMALEERLKERVRALAYPVGHFTNGTKALAREAGYEVAYSYGGGVTFLGSADLFEVRRMPVERFMSRAYFRTMLALPFLT